MPGISGFEYDIFLSYAHTDNETPSEEKKGWVEQFYNTFELSLRQYASNDIKIWWDKRLDGSMVFDKVIEEGISKSAIMLCFSSSSYFKSAYCEKERKLFYEKAKKEPPGIEINGRSRIINVQLYQIPFGEWPDEFEGKTGFQFYTDEDKLKKGRPLGHNVGDFNDRLYPLIGAVEELLLSFSSETQKSAKKREEIQIDETKPSIYFAPVSDTLKTVQKRAITELEKDFNIITKVPPPFDVNGHEVEVKKHLENADLSIHLFDQYPGLEIEETSTFYTQKQVELAKDYGKNPFIWIPKTLDIQTIEEESYKLFIEEQNLEGVVRGLPSDLPRDLMELMTEIQKKKTFQVAPDDSMVLLDTHIDDFYYAWEIDEKLKGQELKTIISKNKDDPRDNIDNLEQLSQVSKIIFFYGHVPQDFLINRVRVALKNISTYENLRLPEFFILMLPDKKDPNTLSDLGRFVDVIDNSDSKDIKSENLNYLFSRLNNERA